MAHVTSEKHILHLLMYHLTECLDSLCVLLEYEISSMVKKVCCYFAGTGITRDSQKSCLFIEQNFV